LAVLVIEARTVRSSMLRERECIQFDKCN